MKEGIPRRAILIPAILLVYLIVMVIWGWSDYRMGLTSPLLYFGGSALCLACIILLHFNLRLRHRHQKD